VKVSTAAAAVWLGRIEGPEENGCESFWSTDWVQLKGNVAGAFVVVDGSYLFALILIDKGVNRAQVPRW
jgi:hypothetical protein